MTLRRVARSRLTQSRPGVLLPLVRPYPTPAHFLPRSDVRGVPVQTRGFRSVRGPRRTYGPQRVCVDRSPPPAFGPCLQAQGSTGAERARRRGRGLPVLPVHTDPLCGPCHGDVTGVGQSPTRDLVVPAVSRLAPPETRGEGVRRGVEVVHPCVRVSGVNDFGLSDTVVRDPLSRDPQTRFQGSRDCTRYETILGSVTFASCRSHEVRTDTTSLCGPAPRFSSGGRPAGVSLGSTRFSGVGVSVRGSGSAIVVRSACLHPVPSPVVVDRGPGTPPLTGDTRSPCVDCGRDPSWKLRFPSLDATRRDHRHTGTGSRGAPLFSLSLPSTTKTGVLGCRPVDGRCETGFGYETQVRHVWLVTVFDRVHGRGPSFRGLPSNPGVPTRGSGPETLCVSSFGCRLNCELQTFDDLNASSIDRCVEGTLR